MVKALTTSLDNLGFETGCARDFFSSVSVYPAGNGHPSLFRGGGKEVKGVRKRSGTPTSVTVVKVGSL